MYPAEFSSAVLAHRTDQTAVEILSSKATGNPGPVGPSR
jgi:hypothetical protein